MFEPPAVTFDVFLHVAALIVGIPSHLVQKRQVTSDKNRFQKILEDVNIKLSVVLTDIFGVTGLKMIGAILDESGYHPEDLLQFVHGRVKASRADILEALKGHVTAHHRFMLRTILNNMSRFQEIMAELAVRIEELCVPYIDDIGRLSEIPGVDHCGAVGIIAEIGPDIGQFPSHHHLASWAGICPGNNESAGKNKSGRVTHGNKYLRSLLSELGWAASRSKGTYFGTKYRSLVGRRGKKKTIIAIGHKILIAAYFIIKDNVHFKELGPGHLDNFRKDELVAYYKKQLKQLESNLEFDGHAA